MAIMIKKAEIAEALVGANLVAGVEAQAKKWINRAVAQMKRTA